MRIIYFYSRKKIKNESKKLFFIAKTIFFIVILIFISCVYIPYNDIWDFEITESMKQNIHEIDDIERWVIKNIKYKRDISEYWRTPQQTLTDGRGDCEDMSILILGIAYKMFNEKGYLCLHYEKNNGHCFCKIKKKEYYNNKLNCKCHQTIYFDDIHYQMRRF